MNHARSLIIIVAVLAPLCAFGAGTVVVGWNDLGMHCMDADYSVFSILPPYNNPHAQLIVNGRLVTGTGTYHLTYEAVADADGSINTTSQGKTQFWTYEQDLFGVALAPDVGLEGNAMPGTANTPQAIGYESAFSWFLAKGVPITPVDDAMNRNAYPMMKIVARDASNAVVATTSIVLPVSDEMTCTACHASGSGGAAQPASGWVWDADPQRDFRLNILKLHDQRHLGGSTYTAALQAAGYSASGLYANATVAGKPVLCDKCHPSNALPVTVATGVPPLTQAMHGFHAQVSDPATGLSMDASGNRSACYRCHPGSETRCLRGAMGGAVGSDGNYSIQCQDCHGSMNAVGASTRQGWFNEPTCQNCHTGTASHNNGQLRYITVFDNSGQPRVAVDSTFATNANTPAAGLSLYRFSKGHGGLQCEACHGSTHAEYPSGYANDNVQSLALQGHKGMLAECAICHGSNPNTVTGGPHGMHPVGQDWVGGHKDPAEQNRTQCQACHGTDYKGTALSRMFANRTIDGIGVWKGYQVSCYLCHNGPGGDGGGTAAPHANNASGTCAAGASANIPLSCSDPGGKALTLRIVSQPSHGRAGLFGTMAIYIPDAGFSGTDTFTYAAWNGYVDSNLATVTVTVTGPPCEVTCAASAPAAGAPSASLTFSGSAQAANCTQALAYDWDFGDGSAHVQAAQASHAYAANGTYQWTFKASSGATVCTKSGTLVVGDLPPNLWMLPLVHTPGDKGAQWRSALTVINTGDADSTVILSYTDSAGTSTQGYTLSAGAFLRWEDATQDLFLLTGDTYGALQVFSDAGLVVSTRIYTGSAAGSYGQSFYGVSAADAVGNSAWGMVPDLLNSSQFRTNVGFLNFGDATAYVTYSMLSPEQEFWPFIAMVPAHGWVQINDIFGQAAPIGLETAWLKFQVQGGPVWAYGSVVDNGSNDPTSLPMVKLAP